MIAASIPAASIIRKSPMPDASANPEEVLPESLALRTEAAVRYWTACARHVLELKARQMPVPALRFDLRGRAAGQAVLSRRRGDPDAIRINARLLSGHPREMLEVTVPHEVAHVAIHRRYNGNGRRQVRPHGPEWRALMAAFGVSDETCHNLPAPPVRRLRRFPYVCGCADTVWLTSIRHRRARRGTVYLCRRCGQQLRHQAQASLPG